jgi:hypothetical protein
MTTLKPQPPCPECEKLAAISDQSNQIGDFLNWLANQGLNICEWVNNEDDDTNEYMPEILLPAGYHTSTGANRLLAKYFEIDLDKVEQERRALLEWLQEIQS